MSPDPSSELVTTPGASVRGERAPSSRLRTAVLLAVVVVAGALGLGIYAGIRARVGDQC